MININFQAETLVRESMHMSRSFTDYSPQTRRPISRPEYTKSRPSKDEYPVPKCKG